MMKAMIAYLILCGVVTLVALYTGGSMVTAHAARAFGAY